MWRRDGICDVAWHYKLVQAVKQRSTTLEPHLIFKAQVKSHKCSV